MLIPLLRRFPPPYRTESQLAENVGAEAVAV